MLNAGDRIGDWIVIDVLGEGGMGAVYRCRNAMSDRIEAAVKVIKPHSLKDELERFVREVESLDTLRHAAVVRIKGWGQDLDRGVLWLAMDIVRGDDLEKVLARGPLDLPTARRVFATVADALRHAHQRGIYHRDIKPANIILGSDGHPWIVDFGIAVQKGRTRLTTMGTVPGTPAYMAPEIFSGEVRPDPVQLDVYALGQVLHEALTGEHAFPDATDTLSTGQALVALMGRKLKAEALDPGPSYPDDLRALIRSATEPEPEDRIPDMNAFYAALAPSPSPRPSPPPTPPNAPIKAGKPTEWVNTHSGSDTTAPPPASEPPRPPPAPPPPPRPESEPSSGGRGFAVFGVFGLLAFGVVAVLGIAALAVVGGIGWTTMTVMDPIAPIEVASTTRDVRVAVMGLTAGTPVEVSVDGRRPENLSSAAFDFGALDVGTHEIAVVVGEGCTLAEAGSCPGCCWCSVETVDIRPGEHQQTIAIEASPPPPADPRPVRVTAPKVDAPWNVFVDLGGASGPTGAVVDRATKRYAAVTPGTYALRVEAGRCPVTARGCWPDGACPDGCLSWTTQVTIPCGDDEYAIVADVGTPRGAPPAAVADSGPACRTTCPAGASRGAAFGDGERVTILAVNEDDAYCGYPGVVGVTGTVSGGLHVNDGCWLGGGLIGDDGVEYYFYKAAFKRAGRAAASPKPAPSTVGRDGRYTGGAIPRGTRVIIVDVHADDAYFAYRDDLLGVGCEAAGDLSAMDVGWFAGPVHCAAAELDLYFYKVALKR